MDVKTISINTPEGAQCRAALRNRFSESDGRLAATTVTDILERVRREGDAA